MFTHDTILPAPKTRRYRVLSTGPKVHYVVKDSPEGPVFLSQFRSKRAAEAQAKKQGAA